jgi:transcriptional regulator with XRE-family HTH domain
MRTFREHLGLSQQALAEAVGGSKRGIQDNEARNRVPGGDVINALVRLGLNANWLLTGEGPMLLADLALQVRQPSSNYQVESPAQIDAVMLQQVIEYFHKWQAENRDRVRIDPSRHGAVIAVLYKVSITAGKVHEPDLAQVLSLAA